MSNAHELPSTPGSFADPYLHTPSVLRPEITKNANPLNPTVDEERCAHCPGRGAWEVGREGSPGGRGTGPRGGTGRDGHRARLSHGGGKWLDVGQARQDDGEVVR